MNKSTYWFAHTILDYGDGEVPLLYFHAIFELTEGLLRSRFTKDARDYEKATAKKLTEVAKSLIAHAALEFATYHYKLGKPPLQYKFEDSDVTMIDAIKTIVDLPETAKAQNGIRVWLLTTVYSTSTGKRRQK